jgi:membrane protein implicated in regulation of membrane protease activity
MLEYMVWFWLGLFVFALVIELFTADMISIWFSLAAVPSFVLALVGANVIAQAIVFVLVTAVLLLLTRPAMKKYMKTNEIKTNVDAIIGKSGVVVKTITLDLPGRVKIGSMDWSAVSKETLEVGKHVKVLDVEGNKLIVESMES